MHLEVRHVDPYGLIDVYDFRPGTSVRLKNYPVAWTGTHWMGPDGEIGEEEQHLEHWDHHFRLRLAPPLSRLPKEPLFAASLVVPALASALAALHFILVPPPLSSELIEIPSSICTMILLRPERPPIVSYGPLEVHRTEPIPRPGRKGLGRADGDRGFQTSTTNDAHGLATHELDWGHPLALQVDAAVEEQKQALALCFRQSGAAGIRLAGTVSIDATVTERGTLDAIQIGVDDFQIDELASCVVDVFTAIEVPGPPEAVAIHYPVRFSAGS